MQKDFDAEIGSASGTNSELKKLLVAAKNEVSLLSM